MTVFLHLGPDSAPSRFARMLEARRAQIHAAPTTQPAPAAIAGFPPEFTITAPSPRLSAGPPAPTAAGVDDTTFARGILDLDARLHRGHHRHA